MDSETAKMKSEMLAIFSDKTDQWMSSQNGQTDGFEYERSYTGAIQDISREVFQLSLGKIPQSKNKKNFKPLME
jgi:hypothetical protein